ncbi:hypothetical protein WJR50_32955 [Catalinimonas sp. 4WD22]
MMEVSDKEKIICPSCSGRGFKDEHVCDTCHGSGEVKPELIKDPHHDTE